MGGRDDMSAGSGLLLKDDHTKFDLTAMLEALPATLATLGTEATLAAIGVILAAVSDGKVWALRGIDYAHSEIHEGQAYSLSAVDEDLDTADELTIAFTTPDTTKWLHMVAKASNSSAGLFEILEGPTITADTGSNMTPVNRNRNSANVSGVLSIEGTPVANRATLNPTITDDGTVIDAEGMGVGRQKGGGGSRDQTEYILKQATTYAFRITGLANDGLASVILSWYEHTDR